MTNNIKQVLEMNKAGTITDEQAEQLINEIMRNQKEPEAAKPETETGSAGAWEENRRRYRDRHGWDDSRSRFSGFAQSTVRGVFDTVAEGMENFESTQSRAINGNDLQLSHVEPPSGKDYVFTGNRVRMSKITELRFQDGSEFTNNKVNASRMNEVKLQSSRLLESEFNASSIVELFLDKSEMQLVEMVSSKVGEARLLNDSILRDSRFHACVLKEFKLEAKSLFEKTRADCTVFSEVTLKGSSLSASEFTDMKMKEVLLDRSTLNRLVVRDAAIAELRVSDSHFDNVLLSSTECWGWKKRGWTKVKIENSTLKNVGFVDCRLHDTVIRDVDIADLKLQGVHLEHQTLVGNDAFLRAVGPYRK